MASTGKKPGKHTFSAEEQSALKTYVIMARAFNAVSERVHAPLRSHRLTVGQFAILEALMFAGPLRANELSRKVLSSSANITLILDNLEKRQLIKRERETEDRRCITVHLTAEGQALIFGIFPQHSRRMADNFAALSIEERKSLAELLKKLGKEKT